MICVSTWGTKINHVFRKNKLNDISILDITYNETNKLFEIIHINDSIIVGKELTVEFLFRGKVSYKINCASMLNFFVPSSLSYYANMYSTFDIRVYCQRNKSNCKLQIVKKFLQIF